MNIPILANGPALLCRVYKHDNLGKKSFLWNFKWGSSLKSACVTELGFLETAQCSFDILCGIDESKESKL